MNHIETERKGDTRIGTEQQNGRPANRKSQHGPKRRVNERDGHEGALQEHVHRTPCCPLANHAVELMCLRVCDITTFNSNNRVIIIIIRDQESFE